VLPEHNSISGNVITNSPYDTNDTIHYGVEGTKDDISGPNPAGNSVDGNCFWNQDPARDVQQPNVDFTEGTNNLAGPPSAGPMPQPPAGPGYANPEAKDFRLLGGPGQCPRSIGPEDPPEVTTLDYDEATHTVGYSITDHTRTSGSSVVIEFRLGSGSIAPGAWASAPVTVPAGGQASGRVPLPDGVDPTGAAPDTLYFQAVAQSPAGFTHGELKVAPPRTVPPPVVRPAPRLGSTANLVKKSGGRARLAGLDLFHFFTNYAQVRLGTEVDASRGPLDVETLGHDGKTGVATVRGGVFIVRQQVGADAPTTLQLSKSGMCASAGRVAAAGRRRVNHLYAHWRHHHGHRLTIGGHYARGSATGTRFFVEDRCRATYLSVQEGSILVKDFSRKRPFRLRAGHHYLARPRGH
jgi:hypothetical protein